jgi:hypothetical protein
MLLTLFSLCGCQVEQTTERRSPLRTAGDAAAGNEAGVLDRPIATRVSGRTTAVVAAVQPRGPVPYDNTTLPIVSADGRFLATQVGLAPNWATIRAEPGATVPTTMRIEIYEIPPGPTDPPQLVATVAEAALLGRSCDAAGFLIESPRENGARWVGRAAWETGQVQWLVADDNAVSAFATIGPNGRLAWSSRPVNGERFDLMVRRGAEEWRLPATEGQWLMPTWSGVDDGLFALLLRDGALDVVHMTASDPAAVRRTLRRAPLATDNATLDTAYQTLNATFVTATGPPPPRDRLVFHHPHRLQAAAWQPPQAPTLLGAGSLVAVIDRDDAEFALVASARELTRRALADERARISLFPGTHVPRATASAERPYVLLEPGDTVIGVTVMKLLPAEEASEW